MAKMTKSQVRKNTLPTKKQVLKEMEQEYEKKEVEYLPEDLMFTEELREEVEDDG